MPIEWNTNEFGGRGGRRLKANKHPWALLGGVCGRGLCTKRTVLQEDSFWGTPNAPPTAMLLASAEKSVNGPLRAALRQRDKHGWAKTPWIPLVAVRSQPQVGRSLKGAYSQASETTHFLG